LAEINYHQESKKTMKEAKSVIAVIFLVVLCASVACAEYNMMMRFGTLFSVFVSDFGLYMLLLGALLRAPEGYEDEHGFHIGARADCAAHIFAVSSSRS
jgi:hypothetical protein